MTKLETLVDRLQRLPTARREELSEALVVLVEEVAAARDAPDWHLEVLAARLAGPDDFADAEEVEAFFARGGA
ncbi:MAG: hypothetical protein IV086_15470 [Hyphomonadaceae bacterium]|nr:MAG: hypothetical protein FD160_2374 [Caulobacteraceae bacterium]MBT9447100.1 hypothetical protein [Hyphomonadaceae bacterium]TPW07668.1 MAG: hypothetical protein FD124_956 [Alphaproteobacteria bacterium]